MKGLHIADARNVRRGSRVWCWVRFTLVPKTILDSSRHRGWVTVVYEDRLGRMHTVRADRVFKSRTRALKSHPTAKGELVHGHLDDPLYRMGVVMGKNSKRQTLRLTESKRKLSVAKLRLAG